MAQIMDTGRLDEELQPRENMGDFNRLDDSALLSVLSFLGPFELARMGQTCRGLAVFSDHEPLWKDLLIQNKGGDWEWQGTFRDTLAAALAGKEISQHQPFPVEGIYSDLLNKSWLCATARFNRAWMGPDTVPREHCDELSVEDFVRRYESANQPVVITGAMRDWPLYRELETWMEQHKNTPFKVGPTRMALGSFRRYAELAHDEDPLYLFDKHFARLCPELPSMYTIPPYWAADRDLFGLLGEEERPDYRWLIVGAPCSGSAFHIDPNGTSAWNAVFSGSKKWIMAPKSVQIPGVYPNASFGEVATTVSAVEWFVDFYSQLRQQGVPVKEVIQRPGEIIFVPQGWFHVVLNLESSIAITHNYVSETNVYNVARFLDQKPDQVSGVSESKKFDLGRKFRAALKEKAPQVMQKIEEREALANAPSEWEEAKAGPGFSLFK